jgi:hypothetical protein
VSTCSSNTAVNLPSRAAQAIPTRLPAPLVSGTLSKEVSCGLLGHPASALVGSGQRIAARRSRKRVNASVDGFSIRHRIETGGRTERIVVFRKRVSGETRKNFQLDLLSPDDGHSEYSMVATKKTIGVQALRAFMAGRGGHEETLGSSSSISPSAPYRHKTGMPTARGSSLRRIHTIPSGASRSGRVPR